MLRSRRIGIMLPKQSMRRKDKDFSRGKEGRERAGDSEGAVRLSVPASQEDSEEVLRRAQKSMEFDDPTTKFVPESLNERGGGISVENVNPEEGWSGQGEEQYRLPMGFVVLGFVAIFGLVVWGVVVALRAEQAVGTEIEGLGDRFDRGLLERRESIEFLTTIEESATGYLASQTVSERARYVRDRERVLPLMESYYEDHPLVMRTFRRVNHFASLGLANRSFMILQIEIGAEGEKEEVVSVIVEQSEDGRLLFDWEAEVSYQPISLEKFIASKSTEPVDFRVYVERDHFYNFEFSDANRYVSVKLTERDSDSFLFGYVERGAEAHRAIEALLARTVTEKEPAIVRVRFMPETASLRSVWIEKIVAPRWIYLGE